MAVSAIGSATPSLAEGIGPANRVFDNSSVFYRVIDQFISDVNMQQLRADQQVERLMTGQTDNIHEVMLALSKADLSFRMFMEVRNRAIDAYQEIMRMQL